MNDTRVTRREVNGVIKHLRQNLFGAEGYKWLLALKRFLRKEDPWAEFAIWRTIHLGGFKTVQDLRQALLDASCRIGDWANNLLGQSAFKLVAEETDADLVVVSVGKLGFKDGATRKEIYERAIQLGLELCPPEIGPQLRLQYKDQPLGEWLLIAMEPITDSGGGLSVFFVKHDGVGLWLGGDGGHPDFFWFAGRRWVFLRRK